MSAVPRSLLTQAPKKIALFLNHTTAAPADPPSQHGDVACAAWERGKRIQIPFPPFGPPVFSVHFSDCLMIHGKTSLSRHLCFIPCAFAGVKGNTQIAPRQQIHQIHHHFFAKTKRDATQGFKSMNLQGGLLATKLAKGFCLIKTNACRGTVPGKNDEYLKKICNIQCIHIKYY